VAHERAEQLAGVLEGQILAGKYRIERVLGAGGMGIVVAARHMQLEETVALKFLLPAALDNPEAVVRFAREARAAVKIKSEHVARVSDVGTLPNGVPYMVMEYLEGEDLAAWLKQRGALPIDQAVEFVLQACVAVADAHALGIVHRDLKPANLFCIRRSDGQLSIKVLDFGISKMTDSSGLASGSPTRTSALMGSPLYMSPEQMRSAKDVDAQTDIWALGVVLFELITGHPAFLGESVTDVAIKVANEQPPSVRSFRPDAPAGVEAVILRCLQKERRQRYRNVAELAFDLLPFAPRAKALVERVTGIIGAAGFSTSPSALSSSRLAARTLHAETRQAIVSHRPGGTLPAIARTTLAVPGGNVALAGAGIAAALGLMALVGSLGLWRQAVGQRDAAVTAATQNHVPSPEIMVARPTPDASNVADMKAADAAPKDTLATLPPIATASLPSAIVAVQTRKSPVSSASPLAPSAAIQPPPAPLLSAPCKLIKTLDKAGEAHFTCPCSSCQ
jgi:serine/threonine-protein kinase